ncbi:hypothetical protein [Vitiosangium sp. GDMCC 1.1324]|uniref:hypothetical protein n=1 Tax=Vitiosangium sp. (strain GDMCC 1.1324) TaxID=2138576 RepID=UPI000D3B6FD1|nr:hypothetical protein [Vitiosangium sp. GDMCC 1.1324]PTL84210.1 hypothetical protein DAT35_12320 [Vitiosangium sp. GDMCC 1.1324]
MSTSPGSGGRTRFLSILSGLFFILACGVLGGVLGISLGVPIDKMLTTHPHALAGLGGLLFGTPLGFLIGLVTGAAIVKRMPPPRRVRLGGTVLLAAIVFVAIDALAISTGLVEW